MDLNEKLDSTNSNYFNQLDTEKWSILHFIFSGRIFINPAHRKLHYFAIFLVVSLFSFVIPFIFACTHFRDVKQMLFKSDSIELPFLWDINYVFMYLIVIPFVITFIISERYFVADSLASVFFGSEKISKDWTKIFGMSNLVGQSVGIVLAAFFSKLFYGFLVVDGSGYWGGPNHVVNPPGMVVFFWQIPLYTWCLTVYFFRYITYIVMLNNLASTTVLNVKLFHPDKCNGLKNIGAIGYRNQYVISIIFLNLIALWVTLKISQPIDLMYLMLVGLTLLNFVLGPIIFFGPLLPFRDKVLQLKNKDLNIISNKIRTEYQTIIDKVSCSTTDSCVNNRLKVLDDLLEKIEKIPVWPFDVSSLRKFLIAYILPAIPAIISGVTLYIFGISGK